LAREPQTVRARPIAQRHVTAAIDESRRRRLCAKRETKQNEQRKKFVHGSASCPPAAIDSR